MSAWPGKFVIGLTGNIGSGKSEVRRMLENLGAFGIDADALAHQAISSGEPAFEAVIQEFGTSILNQDGQIDRARLGKIVFSDPAALSRLEAIIHPRVRQQVDQLIRLATNSVVVIEAIKLIEAGYPAVCDSIWVVAAPEQSQVERLVKYRAMSEELARQRIAAQSPQEDKIQVADVVIKNEKTLSETRRQVTTHWQKIFAPPDEHFIGEK